MNNNSQATWQSVKTEVVRRINQRVWRPGERLPRECDLAEEFGCTRATVNRAMQEIANSGLIDRKRKAGTRVTENPTRTATLRIPITRLEVEKRGAQHTFDLLKRRVAIPPANICRRLGYKTRKKSLHLTTLHLADNQPFMLETRWINLQTIPEATSIDYNLVSANEWLVKYAPFTHGEISMSAQNANSVEAKHLSTAINSALFRITRTTWADRHSITHASLTYAPGYSITTTL